MSRVEILVESMEPAPWTDNIGIFTRAILHRLEKDEWAVGILFTNSEGIRERNRVWRGIDKPTDVLSFPNDSANSVAGISEGEEIDAGDIIIAPEVVRQNADEWGVSFDEEIKRVTVHGILHLAGLDHPGDDYEGEMLTLQEQLLAEWAENNVPGEHG